MGGSLWQRGNTLRNSWTSALALAPFVLGVVACSGTEVANDSGTPTSDSGVALDSGSIPADSGAPTDSGIAPDSGSIADAGLLDAARVDSGAMDAGQGTPDAGNPGCTYPPGAVEPMALNEVLTAHSWPTAIDGTGNRFDLDLTKVHCTNDEDIDWSPFDALLFISIPAF